MSSIDASDTVPEPADRLVFPASLNLRDLGGLPTSFGLKLATGRLFRSGDPFQVHLLLANSLVGLIGIRTCIDLRTSRELKHSGGGQRPASCNYQHCPLFETVHPNWVNPVDQSPNATATRYMQMLDEGVDALVRIVRMLGERDTQPVMIHCAAGRDRTGIVIACVLELLGVPDEVIATDYALSDGLVKDGGRAHSETMFHFLDLLRKRWGSTRQMLSVQGASEVNLDRLPSLFVTE